MKRDYYSILNVQPKASAKVIERAYLKLARRLHPDVNPGDKKAEAQFRRVQEAYRVLSDPESRRHFDRTGEGPAAGREKRARKESETAGEELRAWENIFRDIFHDGAAMDGESPSEKGEDIHQVLEISFAESLVRTKRQIAYQRDVPCSRCGGSRYEPEASVRLCQDCGGKGLVSLQRGPYQANKLCHSCEGSGKTGDPPCRTCRGKGRVLKRERKAVTLAPGSDSGTQIAVPGGGQPGKGGGESGDLIVTIRVTPHPKLERKGYNLYTAVPVTVAEAALGKMIRVPAAGETVSLKLPPGTQASQQFCLRGKGVPRRGGTAGDLYVTVQVVVPAAKDGEARRLFREIEKMFPENPRLQG